METSYKHIEGLTKLHLATVESLTMAIDAKDDLSRGHIQRVRKLAEGLGRAVGYPEDQMEGLKAAALLHDIGKLAVPEYILSKPGKLTAAEYCQSNDSPGGRRRHSEQRRVPLRSRSDRQTPSRKVGRHGIPERFEGRGDPVRRPDTDDRRLL